jgi:glycine/D-amino acid oxidase-like deaminating enzyme
MFDTAMPDAVHDTLPDVVTDTAFPARTTVVVVGGGIIGVSTALFLAQRGIPVVLAEKGRIGGEQSSRNWGWCRTMGRDLSELPLSIESLRLWRQMDRLCGGHTGYREAGVLYTCDTPAEMAAQEAWLDQARQFQIEARLLRDADLAALLPGAARRFAGGLHTPSDGRAEPGRAAPAIAEGARRLGATILTGCAVRGLETRGGRICGVVTERGPIACDSVVLAGGAWSRLFCGSLGLDLPQLKVLGSVLRTRPLEGLPEVAVGASDFAFRRRADGGFTVARRGANITPLVPDSFRLFADYLPAYSKNWRELRLRLGRGFLQDWQVPRRWALDRASPFEQVRVLDPEPSADLLAEAKRNLTAAFPAFARMEEAERWGGLIDVTPDAIPVISPVEALPGFFIGTGFSGHGFGLGPGAGRLMADLVAGDAPLVDPAPFRLDRFRRAAASAAALPAAAR